jgi:hypothetical protein
MDKNEKRERLTDLEILKHVEETVDMMTKGFATRSIINEFSQRGFSSRQIRNFMEKAALVIKEMYKDNMATIYETSLNRLEMLYQAALQKGHLKTAIEIQKEIDKISGLHSGRLEITGEIKIPDIIRIAEIRNPDEGTRDQGK